MGSLCNSCGRGLSTCVLSLRFVLIHRHSVYSSLLGILITKMRLMVKPMTWRPLQNEIVCCHRFVQLQLVPLCITGFQWQSCSLHHDVFQHLICARAHGCPGTCADDSEFMEPFTCSRRFSLSREPPRACF